MKIKHDFIGSIVFALLILCGTNLVLAAIDAIYERLYFTAIQSQEEQIKAAINQHPSNHYFVSQAVEFNKVVAKQRALNSIWWRGPLIPDGWETQQFIIIDRAIMEKKNER